MAKTLSTTTSVTLQNPGSLNVVNNFNALMTASMAENSIYDIARTNLEDFTSSLEMTAIEKANVLADMYKGIITGLTTQCMNIALQQAVEDRDGPYKLTKMYHDTLATIEQKNKVAADNELTTEQKGAVTTDKNFKVIQGWKIQADMVREDGAVIASLPTIETAKLSASSVGNTGTKYSQEKQSLATVNSLYAKAYRESGIVAWTAAADGELTAATPAASSGTNAAGLTSAQTNVAIRQEEGFDDNMLQHVANSSASFLGILSGGDNFPAALEPTDGAGGTLPTPMKLWGTAINEINRRAVES